MEHIAGGAMQNQGSAEYETVIKMGLGFIGNFLLNVASIFTYVGGMLLEGAIHFYVVNMVESAPLPVINAVWAVVRDICNLLFVFGFLYLGFQMIFDPHSAEAKRTLSHIIIGALLVNFSLFFVKVIIDVGNYVTVSIYNAGTAAVGGASIPAAIVQALGISAFWGTGGTGVGNTNPDILSNLDGWGGVAYYFMAAIFLIVCAFVFTIAALMLVTRFVTLIMILMASPLLFAGTAFPQAQHFVQEMWQKLVTSSLFPTVFLFMMFVSVKILDFLKTGIPGAGDNKAAALQGSVTFLPVVIFFCGSIFILLQALQISRKISEGGHDAISHLTQHAHDSFRGFVLRNTAGRAGRALHHSYEAGSTTRANGNWFGRGVQKTLDLTIDRQIRHTLHDAETSKFGGHHSLADIEKDNKERDAHRAKHKQEHDVQHAIEHDVQHSTTDTKIAMERAISNASTEHILKLLEDFSADSAERTALVGGLSSSQFDSLMKAKPSELNDGEKEELRKVRGEMLKTKYGIVSANSTTGTPGNPGTIKKASAADLEAMGLPVIKEHAVHLNTKQIDEMKGLTPTEKDTLKKTREAQLKTMLGPTSTPGSAKRLLAHVGNDTEISKLPADILKDPHVSRALNANVLSKIMDNDGITDADRQVIRGTIEQTAALNGPTPASKFLANSPRGQSF